MITHKPDHPNHHKRVLQERNQNQKGFYSPWMFAQTRNLLWQGGAYIKHIGILELTLCVFLTQESYGDISERVVLRDRLKCQSFDWYLRNIYPDLHVPEDREGWHGAVSFPNLHFGWAEWRCTCFQWPSTVVWILQDGFHWVKGVL